MDRPEAAQLDLLAEIDALVEELQAWREQLPSWPPNRYVRAAVDRLLTRVDHLRIRFDAPLVVATLGGTGTGKSTLVNALVGSVVSTPGRQRPTTRKPVLICRREITPEMLGIPRDTVELVHHDTPALANLVLLDCPDPDTAEDAAAPQSNTARLRQLLPHCDVLLVTGTQQKYRSARVGGELATAASGARLVFVQTHADTEDDIRADWRAHLANDYVTGEMFFVDSLAALADAQSGQAPRGEFARLVEYLSHELSGSAAHRIRRANFLDLVDETLAGCREKAIASIPALEQVERAVTEQRARLAARLSVQMCDELQTTRRSWESRLLGEVAGRWGLSPFALVLRAYQGIGSLLSGAALWRVRTPAQLALWGAWEGARRLKSHHEQRTADDAGARAVGYSWDDSELRTAAIIVDGYAAEAGIEHARSLTHNLASEASDAGQEFVERAGGELQELVSRVAARQSGRFTRLCYESLTVAMFGLLLYRLGKNFFYDSWLAYELGLVAEPKPMLGIDFFIAAGVVSLLWCALLLTLFNLRLRRGLNYEITQLAARWNNSASAAPLFAELDEQIARIRQSQERLERLIALTRDLQSRLAMPSSRLGHRLAEAVK